MHRHQVSPLRSGAEVVIEFDIVSRVPRRPPYRRGCTRLDQGAFSSHGRSLSGAAGSRVHLNPQRDRAVVYQRHFHHGAELARRYRGMCAAGARQHVFEQLTA